MRIGIMLRHLDQHGGGVLVYTENLLRELFALETDHEFVLLHRGPKSLGRFGGNDRVTELALPSSSVLAWDQVAAARACASEQLDLLFNPKYSLPLAARCPGVFVCHGLDWFVEPRWSPWRDRLSHRLLLPLYVRKAARIIAVSETTKQHLQEFLGVDPDRVTTIHHGVDEVFREPPSKALLEEVRRRYELPERFLLYCGQIYPPKNFERLIRAFARVGPALGVSLVVAGSHTWLSDDALARVDELDLGSWVVQPGWIDREDLPAFYALAEALALPSLYESFGLPLVEAMAIGCPVVTSNRHAMKEVTGEAGIHVNPESVEDIAEGMRRVLTDDALRRRLIAAGRCRAGEFSWRDCARRTLDVLESACRAT